jgi:hypothetical protein
MNFFLNCKAKLGLQNKKKFIKFGLLDTKIFTKNDFLSFGKKWYFFGQKSIMIFILDFQVLYLPKNLPATISYSLYKYS